jgi:hypothetical protein
VEEQTAGRIVNNIHLRSVTQPGRLVPNIVGNDSGKSPLVDIRAPANHAVGEEWYQEGSVSPYAVQQVLTKLGSSVHSW